MLFEKVYYKIGEVGRLTGLKEYVIRYWESEFSLIRPKKNNGGQRLYTSSDIEAVLRIKKMLYEEGYTIAGAKNVLKNERNEHISEAEPEKQADLLLKIKNELLELKKILF